MAVGTLSEDHKQKIIDGRKQALEEKEKQRVKFKISGFTIESYEYGWRVCREDDGDWKFFPTFHGLSRYLVDKKVSTSGAKTLNELVEKINNIQSEIYKELDEFKK